MNQSGMSLLETMIAAGIGIVVTLGLTTMITNQNVAIRGIEQKSEFNELSSALRMVLSDANSCAVSFAKVVVSPTESGLENWCYDGIDPVISPVTLPSGTPSARVGNDLLHKNGENKYYGNLLVNKLCLKLKTGVVTTQNGAPQDVQGLATLIVQGKRVFGGALKEREIILRVHLEKLPDNQKFNVMNKGTNFDPAEPTTNPVNPNVPTSIRPVNFAYRIKECSTESSIVPGGGGGNSGDFVSVKRDSSQNPNGPIYFTQEVQDSNSLFDLNQPTRLMIQKDGKYAAWFACVGGAAQPTGVLWGLAILKFPGGAWIASENRMGTPVGMGLITISGFDVFKKGEYVEFHSNMQGPLGGAAVAGCQAKLAQIQ